jgi:4-aminobutyrate--pyruvate transaminase
MSIIPNSIEARDVASVFHGYTNLRAHLQHGPLVMERGEGIYVYDNADKRYIEGMAGLWSVGLGFSEERLIDAAVAQMRKLPFYHNFTSKSHAPQVELAERLVSLAPVPMSKAYFANSGSEANDSAYKMIRYRANAMGTPERKKVISRLRAYHGITYAAASLTGLPNNHKSFDLPIDGIFHTTCPHHWREGRKGESEEAFATRLAEELEELILREGPETIAAFWGEPVMGAGGVVVPPSTYWQKIQAILKKYDILLVVDEVITAFGRTGKMFACETFGIDPDIIVVSKQLSSSYMPISALIVNERVFEPIAYESNRIGTFGHGFTAGGHPVAAAVSVEVLNILEERRIVDQVAETGNYFLEQLHGLADHSLVGEVRGVGLLAALELVTSKESKTALETPGKLGGMVNAAMQENGLISRAMIDAMAFCPPMIIDRNQIDDLIAITRKSLDAVANQLGL